MRALIKSIYAQCHNLIGEVLHQEKGQVLPIALAVLALGTLVIGPFLSHAGTVLKSSGQYKKLIDANYACEAGVEQAIWALTNNALEGELSELDSSLSYNLSETVNSLTCGVTITFLRSKGGNPIKDKVDATNSVNTDGSGDSTGIINTFLINSSAGETAISATVNITDGVPTVLSWDISP